MAIEIERKFLVTTPGILDGRCGEHIIQGYVAKEPGAMTTRVRVRAGRAYLTLKGPRCGLSRDEFEYRIPLEDALQMLSLYCVGRIVEKTRYLVEVEAHTFEVDAFEGRHAGLVIAELELSHERAPHPRPAWLGREVTHDFHYGNYFLAHHGSHLLPVPWQATPPAARQARQPGAHH